MISPMQNTKIQNTLPHGMEGRVSAYPPFPIKNHISFVVPVGRNHAQDSSRESLYLPVNSRIVLFAREWFQLLWACEGPSQSGSHDHIVG